MKTAIILHGLPSKDEYYKNLDLVKQSRHWLPWLQAQLIKKGILAQTPQMPHPYEPVYEEWKKVFEYFPINEDTLLVGHSCGGGFIIRYLAENNINVGKVILVAPWLDPGKYLEGLGCAEFFDFEFNSDVANKILNQVHSIDILYSTDDDENILKTVEIIKQNFGTNSNNAKINYHEFTDRGHFTTEPGYENNTIPEVLDLCV